MISRRYLYAGAGLLGLLVAPVAVGLAYLKLNESELVFRAESSRPWQDGFIGQAPASATEVRIELANGQWLRGFTLPAAAQRDQGYWVLHLHGNADSAYSDTQMANVQRLAAQGLSVLAFDYRGFGASPGTASEAGMYEDAQAAWQWLLAHGVPPEKILIWGHSLGSGPATLLATRHRAAALVLFGAFTSIPDRAAELYPWLPVRWIAGIHFDSLSRMPQLRTPLVLFHSHADAVIPHAHSQRLLDAAPAPKHLYTLELRQDDGFGGHVTALYEQLEQFMPRLRELAGMPEP